MNGVGSIAVGLGHSLAATSDGTVWTWGWNAGGQLGDGTTTDRASPVRVQGAGGVLSVSTAACGRGGGTRSASSGTGGTTDRWAAVTVPVAPVGTGVIAAGAYHSLAG